MSNETLNTSRNNLLEPGRDRVVDALSACRTFEDVKALGILFHGTCEEIDGDLAPGGYDNVTWAAKSPDVAQAYIPRSGISTWIFEPADYQREDRVQPAKNTGWLMRWCLERAGVTMEDLDIEWNGQSVYSWRIPENWPTEGDLDDYVKSLGYKPESTGCSTVLLHYDEDGVEQLMPADWSMPGHLIVILPAFQSIWDPEWSEDALGYATHNRVVDFQTFEDRGVPAFRMSDCLQSNYHGNVPHESVGILKKGREGISWLAIPAVRHDGPDLGVFHGGETPEFAAFMKSLNADYRTIFDIEKDTRRYVVMTDSTKTGERVARKKHGSDENGFWTATDAGAVWLMDRQTAEDISGRLVFNNPQIMRAEKALKIIEEQKAEVAAKKSNSTEAAP